MSRPGHEWAPHEREGWSVCSRCGMVRNYNRDTTTCSGALPKIRQRSEAEVNERQPILGEVPTELVNGEWRFPTIEGPEPSAVITYTDEPSPETGDVGWCWWAYGSMGCAPTYEGACRAAEAEIKRRIRNRMAVL